MKLLHWISLLLVHNQNRFLSCELNQSNSPGVVTLLCAIGQMNISVILAFLWRWEIVSFLGNFPHPLCFGIILAAKWSLQKSWAQEHGERGFLWPLLSFQNILLSNYSQGAGTVGWELLPRIQRGEPWQGVEGKKCGRWDVFGYLCCGKGSWRAALASSWSRHSFDLSLCRNRPTEALMLTISSEAAGVRGSCGAVCQRRGQHYCEVADLGQKWGSGE